MAHNLKTGDLVLCKVGSFPPWPAVVFPQRLLRNDVYRKRRANCIAVCFFNDPTYYWEQPHKLKSLNRSMIDKFLLQDAASVSQEDLIEAYRQAQSFSSLNDFIVDRLKEEDRLGELQEELERERVKSGEDPFMSKADSRKRRTAISKNTSSSKNKQITPKGEESVAVTIQEERDGDYDGSQIKRRKKSKLDRSRRVEISLLLRRRLQQNLVQRESVPLKQDILESHRLLNKILENLDCDPPFFDINALRESKLHKLLKVIVNTPELSEFHATCKEILVHWSDIAAELKAEKMAAERQKQHPTDQPTTETTIV
ncbi:YLR455W [Zygosaccharomyces parabailii]|nr:YLR455W [Zygosaccharomyces parabailii]CDH10554.1 related to PWWP domain-containing protein YLR455W [Zygosaccharomyces bailii ISA1307]